jgi:hypothetical protein
MSNLILLNIIDGKCEVHQQGGKGIVSNFAFSDIQMNDVSNPIIIDQKYCPHSEGTCSGSVSISILHFDILILEIVDLMGGIGIS